MSPPLLSDLRDGCLRLSCCQTLRAPQGPCFLPSAFQTDATVLFIRKSYCAYDASINLGANDG